MRDAAYRSRDHAYRALLAADELHHDDDERADYCSCDRRAQECKEMAALAPAVNALRRWAYHQIERLRRGLPDGLPDDHPEVLRLGQSNRQIWSRFAG